MTSRTLTTSNEASGVERNGSTEALGDARSSTEETRLRIMAAARALYARHGSRGTTTREVAAEAHVNEATVFRHFGTKGHLLSTMLDYYNDTASIPEVLDGLPRSATLEEQLRALARSAIDSMRRKEDLIKIAMAEEISYPEGQLCSWRSATAAKESLTRYFGQKVESGELQGDPAWLARVFMSMFFSYVMARRLWCEVADTPPERAIATMVDVFLNGAHGK
ncbi:MAG: TetR/AcrR family transcriptional regulator [Candidatus Eremiobacteraeota bacterium]|nr:TetR/AcrR family transcriptional regulator [Candidatus Eremiobacteraeota bacterium]